MQVSIQTAYWGPCPCVHYFDSLVLGDIRIALPWSAFSGNLSKLLSITLQCVYLSVPRVLLLILKIRRTRMCCLDGALIVSPKKRSEWFGSSHFKLWCCRRTWSTSRQGMKGLEPKKTRTSMLALVKFSTMQHRNIFPSCGVPLETTLWMARWKILISTFVSWEMDLPVYTIYKVPRLEKCLLIAKASQEE